MTTETTISTDSAVDNLLAQQGIKFSVALIGETKREDWTCDAWRFTLSAGKQAYTGDFYTGIGHRKAVKGAPADKGNPNTLYREDWEKRWLNPVAPSAASVLYSLLLDSRAADMSFDDWASEYGYSDDSIKALESYRACCKTARELRGIFKPEVREALQALLQDY